MFNRVGRALASIAAAAARMNPFKKKRAEVARIPTKSVAAIAKAKKPDWRRGSRMITPAMRRRRRHQERDGRRAARWGTTRRPH